MDFELINKSDAVGGPGGLDTAAPAAPVPSDGIDKTLPSSVVDTTPGEKKEKKDACVQANLQSPEGQWCDDHPFTMITVSFVCLLALASLGVHTVMFVGQLTRPKAVSPIAVTFNHDAAVFDVAFSTDGIFQLRSAADNLTGTDKDLTIKSEKGQLVIDGADVRKLKLELAHGLAEKEAELAYRLAEKEKELAHGLAEKEKELAHGLAEKEKGEKENLRWRQVSIIAMAGWATNAILVARLDTSPICAAAWYLMAAILVFSILHTAVAVGHHAF